MTAYRKEDRIQKLRQDPDFHALVKLLDEQKPEQVESFINRYDTEEDEEDHEQDLGGEATV